MSIDGYDMSGSDNERTMNVPSFQNLNLTGVRLNQGAPFMQVRQQSYAASELSVLPST